MCVCVCVWGDERKKESWKQAFETTPSQCKQSLLVCPLVTDPYVQHVWLKLKSRSFLIIPSKIFIQSLIKEFFVLFIILGFFIIFFIIFFFCRDDRTPQDFGPREHVERINFQELLQHFKNLQQKHFMSKHARPNCRAKNQLLNV